MESTQDFWEKQNSSVQCFDFQWINVNIPFSHIIYAIGVSKNISIMYICQKKNRRPANTVSENKKNYNKNQFTIY